MLQIIGCKKCGKSDIGFNKTYVNIDFKKSIYCDKCRKVETKIETNFFCSVNCFREYFELLTLEELECKREYNESSY